MSLFLEDVRLLEARAEKFGLREEAAVCAAMLEDVLGPDAEKGLKLSARIEPIAAEASAAPGARITLPVRVENRSTISYRDGAWPVYLSYHLLSESGVLLRHDNPRTKFGTTLRPGDQRVIELEVEAPDVGGSYVLSIDLVLERITWFEAEGTRPGVVRLRVEAPGQESSDRRSS